MYLNHLFALDGKVAVVIGGGGVLGGAIARGLAEAGAKIAILGRTREKVEKQARVIRQNANTETLALPVDASKKGDLGEAQGAILSTWGRVDILINAAGVNSATPFFEVSEDAKQKNPFEKTPTGDPRAHAHGPFWKSGRADWRRYLARFGESRVVCHRGDHSCGRRVFGHDDLDDGDFSMKWTFRWFGENDPVTLANIRQIPGMTGIVSALYDIPIGEVWSSDRLDRLKSQIELAGLTFDVVESIPVHEDIKLGLPGRDRLIDAYCQSVVNMGELGISVLTYNFMPVFDWMRTDLRRSLPDGSTSLCYDHNALSRFDLTKETLELPGWATAYSAEALKTLLAQYREFDQERLWDNLACFLETVIPVAAEAKVRMALHPDDPPWSIFGLPRIIVNEAALQRAIALVDNPANGITFCTGTLAANPENDLPAMIRKFAGQKRIHFVHCRNIRITGEKCFHETAHPSCFGKVDMFAVMQALHQAEYDGPVRPDHGRMIWGESGRPGYGLHDRALGAAYLYGLWEGLERNS